MGKKLNLRVIEVINEVREEIEDSYRFLSADCPVSKAALVPSWCLMEVKSHLFDCEERLMMMQ